MEWMESAACASTGDPDMWFPGKGESAEAARLVCAVCPVQQECLLLLQSLPADWQRHGVWAGTTAMQRREQPTVRWCRRCGGRIPGDAATGTPFCSQVCRREARAESQRTYDRRRKHGKREAGTAA